MIENSLHKQTVFNDLDAYELKPAVSRLGALSISFRRKAWPTGAGLGYPSRHERQGRIRRPSRHAESPVACAPGFRAHSSTHGPAPIWQRSRASTPRDHDPRWLALTEHLSNSAPSARCGAQRSHQRCERLHTLPWGYCTLRRRRCPRFSRSATNSFCNQ